MVRPRNQRIEHFSKRLRVCPPRPGWNMEGVIGALDRLQCRSCPKPAHKANEKLHVREGIAGSLQEQHRDVHLGQMRCTVVRRFPRGMQRKSEESQALDPRQRCFGLRLRRHTPTKGFASGNQRKGRHEFSRRSDGCTHRGVRERRPIRGS